LFDARTSAPSATTVCAQRTERLMVALKETDGRSLAQLCPSAFGSSSERRG
jgi:hypothetical protein